MDFFGKIKKRWGKGVGWGIMLSSCVSYYLLLLISSKNKI